MNLNLIIHGRCGSTLVSEMLMSTGKFDLWGTRSWANELKAFKNPETWNIDDVDNALAKYEDSKKAVLAKLPEFAYFVECTLRHTPNIIVLERSIPERVRSLSSVGWIDRANERYQEKGLHKRACAAFLNISGVLYEWDELDKYEKASMVLGWGNWRVRKILRNYKWKVHIQFDDLIMRPNDVYGVFDSVFGFKPQLFWSRWDAVKKKTLQNNARKSYEVREFLKPYDIKFNRQNVISEIIATFGG